MKRIPPSELLEKKAKELIEENEAEDLTSELIKMGARNVNGRLILYIFWPDKIAHGLIAQESPPFALPRPFLSFRR